MDLFLFLRFTRWCAFWVSCDVNDKQIMRSCSDLEYTFTVKPPCKRFQQRPPGFAAISQFPSCHNVFLSIASNFSPTDTVGNFDRHLIDYST